MCIVCGLDIYCRAELHAGVLMVVCQKEKENSLSTECCQNPAFVL